MEGSNDNNNTKTAKTATTLLTLVLVASFAGTMISMPQMIGSANAQSSSNACPAGFTLKQGKCTQIATCQSSPIYSVTGGPFTNGTCTYICIDPTRCGTSTATLPAICPNGGQLIGNECVIKPGNRT